MITNPINRFRPIHQLRIVALLPIVAGLAVLALPALTPAQDTKRASFTVTLPKSVVKLRFIPVPGGTFTMKGKPVTVEPYWIAETETPWEAFDAFLASGPPSEPYDQREFKPDAIARPSKSYILPDLGWGHNGYPSINLSFTSATMFGRWLASASKKKFRLPTEAEWEWACREASTAPMPPLVKAIADKSAWYASNSKEQTHPVAKKAPNKLGLYDMHGNVGEWATNGTEDGILCGATFLDPLAKLAPTTRRTWQPSWQESDPQFPKSRWWLSNGPFAGFRLVCEP